MLKEEISFNIWTEISFSPNMCVISSFNSMVFVKKVLCYGGKLCNLHMLRRWLFWDLLSVGDNNSSNRCSTISPKAWGSEWLVAFPQDVLLRCIKTKLCLFYSLQGLLSGPVAIATHWQDIARKSHNGSPDAVLSAPVEELHSPEETKGTLMLTSLFLFFGKSKCICQNWSAIGGKWGCGPRLVLSRTAKLFMERNGNRQGFTTKIVSYRSKLPLTPSLENENNLILMPANSECHLQFLMIYLFYPLCHTACILLLTKPVLGPVEMDRDFKRLCLKGRKSFFSEIRLAT